MARMKLTTGSSSKHPEQAKGKKGLCSRKRDIIFGFWFGIAGAAMYVSISKAVHCESILSLRLHLSLG